MMYLFEQNPQIMNTKHPKKNEEVNGGNKMLLLGSSIPAIHVLQSISHETRSLSQ